MLILQLGFLGVQYGLGFRVFGGFWVWGLRGLGVWGV